MPKPRTSSTEVRGRRSRPALTPEARQNQLITLAVDLAEQQLRDGTASSQVLTHYLKLATAREQKELEILEQQRKLYEAKTRSYGTNEELKEMYQQALNAMRTYSGGGSQNVN